MRKVNLEHDLIKSDYITNKCSNSESYSQNLYAAMCNNLFYKNDEEWSCSWRYAGGVVADIRSVGESYMDFYCSGIGSGHEEYVGESFVTDEIRSDLLELGWTIKEYPQSEQVDALQARYLKKTGTIYNDLPEGLTKHPESVKLEHNTQPFAKKEKQ